MNIALDYDGTYTNDPELWDKLIEQARARGHKVYCVTMRYPTESNEVYASLAGKVDDIILTCRMAKLNYLAVKGITIDVWIDDRPDFVLMNASK